MEQMPYHREGIQEQLDKAYDEGHQDNKALDEAQAKIAEIKGEEGVKEERGRVDDKEMRGELSLEETVALLKDAGYLDTSFEGKEIHPLTMRPLSKEEVIAEYKTSGGETWVWDELEKNMPYATPNAESLDVMMMNFNKSTTSDEVLAEMDKLGVRPFTYEELIQYGIAHPSHQEQNHLVGLGSKHSLDGSPHAPVLGFVDGGGRGLIASPWGSPWGDGCRFPVVRK